MTRRALFTARPVAAAPRGPRRSARFLAATALAAVALTHGACGGDGDDSASEPLPRATLIARANAACRAAAAEVARVPVAASIEELGSYAQRIEAIGSRLHEQLTRLTPEQPDSSAYGRYLDALGRSNAQLRALEQAADDGDRAGVSRAAREIAGAQVGTYAAVIGFDVCAAAAPTPTS